jgi:hypothetical protein
MGNAHISMPAEHFSHDISLACDVFSDQSKRLVASFRTIEIVMGRT